MVIRNCVISEFPSHRCIIFIPVCINTMWTEAVITSAFSWRDLQKPRNPSVWISGVPAGIRTEQLSTTNAECYRLCQLSRKREVSPLFPLHARLGTMFQQSVNISARLYGTWHRDKGPRCLVLLQEFSVTSWSQHISPAAVHGFHTPQPLPQCLFITSGI